MESTAASEMDNVSRILLTGWNAISVFLSVLGNTFVLVASKHGKAIKLDRVSIVLLENLAVADIGTSLFWILPYLIWLYILNPERDYSAYVITWELKTSFLLSLIFMAAGTSLVTFLNCCKFFRLLFPLRARIWRYRDGYKIVAVVWLSVTLAGIGTWVGSTHLDYSVLTTTTAAGTLLLLSVVLVSTFGLLHKVHKARGLKKQGVFSIILVSVILFVSYTPLCASQLLSSINGARIGELPFRRLVTLNIYYINCFSNPLIYYFTLKSFKEYVHMIFEQCTHDFKCTASVHSHDDRE